eukprot:5288229-Pyramimonas_sp.AAC.1
MNTQGPYFFATLWCPLGAPPKALRHSRVEKNETRVGGERGSEPIKATSKAAAPKRGRCCRQFSVESWASDHSQRNVSKV